MNYASSLRSLPISSSFMLPSICYMLPSTLYMPLATCNWLLSICYLLFVTRFLLIATCYFVLDTYYLLYRTYYLLLATDLEIVRSVSGNLNISAEKSLQNKELYCVKNAILYAEIFLMMGKLIFSLPKQ